MTPFDLMEQALRWLYSLGKGRSDHSYPLTPELLAMTQGWTEGGTRTAYAKGAPEAIAVPCGLPKGALRAALDAMAAKGQWVLAVAVADAPKTLPADQAGFDFHLLGLFGLVDALRKGVPKAVATCKAAGVRVIMITGDHPATVLATAHEAGFGKGLVVTGDALAKLSDAALTKTLAHTTVFARIMPDQKLRLVQALKTEGAIEAMTGDRVNDAPSLKAAHIGAAMGGRGTDVACEAALIVLLDDDFGSIVTTIALGRRIYENLRKAMRFILAVHVLIAGLALLPLILGTPLLFGPVHIGFLEMIIDPVCALAFEADEGEFGLITRSPRPVSKPLFSAPTVFWSLLQGVAAFAFVAAVFLVAPRYGMDADQTRALTFAALVLSIIALILVNRVNSASVFTALTRRNRALGAISGIVAAMLALVMGPPAARDLFDFALPPTAWILAPLAAGFGVLRLLEMLKPLLIPCAKPKTTKA